MPHLPSGKRTRRESPPAGYGADGILTPAMDQQAVADEALRLSENRLRAVLESAVDAIITIDHRGIVHSVNPATERMFGYTAAEIVGNNVSMLMPSPYHEEHDEYLGRYLRTGEKHIIGIGREVEARRKDGTVFAIDLAVSEVEPGRIFTGIVRDISDRKLAEARVREADRMASLGTLAAGLGHDMNNMLLPVRAHLNALRNACSDAPEQCDHVEKIQKGVAYLQQLADGLHFLAMNPEKEEDAQGVTDLKTWWGQTGALLSKAVPKHVTVVTSFPDHLPEVKIAAHALTQAILNLVVNAGEAIPVERSMPGKVHIRAEQTGAGDMIAISVADNGTGMSEEVKRRAFDMFFTTKIRGLGTGLGLALVRKVVEQAGGTVEVQSALGKGTTVTLKIPAGRSDDQALALRAALTIRDGRFAALLRNLLEVSGTELAGDAAEPNVHIWIADPGIVTAANALTWREAHPAGHIVLFGEPADSEQDAWDSLDPFIIYDETDLEAVREAIGDALAACSTT